MGEFREQYLSDVREVLNRSEHRAEDFEISQKSNSDFKILFITYRYHPSFSCQLQVRTRATTEMEMFPVARRVERESIGTIHVFCSPGEILSKEHHVYDEPREALRAVKDWVDRIRAELLAIPANRRIEEQRVQLDELTAQFAEMEAGYFTVDEAEELKARLEAFERDFAERIQAAGQSSADVERRIGELHQEVENLKQQLQYLDRKGWVKSAMVRIFRWSSDPQNRQLVKSSTDLAKSLLLPPGSAGGSS